MPSLTHAWAVHVPSSSREADRTSPRFRAFTRSATAFPAEPRATSSPCWTRDSMRSRRGADMQAGKAMNGETRALYAIKRSVHGQAARVKIWTASSRGSGFGGEDADRTHPIPQATRAAVRGTAMLSFRGRGAASTTAAATTAAAPPIQGMPRAKTTALPETTNARLPSTV